MDRGGMMIFAREPSGRRASTMGEDSSTRRPTAETILSMMCIRCALSLKTTLVLSRRAAAFHVNYVVCVHQDVVDIGSCRSGSRGPRPKSSSRTSLERRSRSCRVMGVRS